MEAAAAAAGETPAAGTREGTETGGIPTAAAETVAAAAEEVAAAAAGAEGREIPGEEKTAVATKAEMTESEFETLNNTLGHFFLNHQPFSLFCCICYAF